MNEQEYSGVLKALRTYATAIVYMCVYLDILWLLLFHQKQISIDIINLPSGRYTVYEKNR